MSDLISDPESPRSARFGRAKGLRWQLIVLGIGLLMIAAAGLFMLLYRSPAEEETPEVQAVDFVETATFSEAIVGQPALVNPLLASSQADRDLVALVFSGLTRVDTFGQPAPDLARSWDVSADGLTYTFHLRDDVTWHDGKPFTAEDIAFTMGLLRDPDFPGPADLATFWRTVETYVVDETTVQFVLTQPLTAFPEFAGIGVLPAHLLGGIPPAEIAEDSFNLSPVGTGRLQWASAETLDDVIVVHLKPYAGFYDQERRIRFEEVTLLFFSRPADAFRALGPQAQALGGLSAAQLNAAVTSPNLNIYTSRLPAYTAILFNQQAGERLPFFQQVEVRQALAAALNRQEIVEEALPRQALVANSPLLPGTWAYDANVPPVAYDPAGAAALLDEAGWPLEGNLRASEETTLAFTLLVSDREADQRIGEAVVEQWRALGVDVSLEVVEPARLVAQLQRATEQGRDFDAALVEFSQGDLADPDPYPFWHESQIAEGQNYSGFNDRVISEALEIARKDPNGVRRAELYHTFQARFIEQAAAILLYNPLYHYAVSCQVQGPQVLIITDPADRFRNMHEWRIVSASEMAQACPGQ